MTGTYRLLHDHPKFTYVCPHGHRTVRHARAWQSTEGRITVIVTEGHDDTGISVTNAAEQVLAEAQKLYPHVPVVVVEHYPDDPGYPEHPFTMGERFAWITQDPATGRVEWTHLPRELVLYSLGVAEYPTNQHV